MKQESKRCTAVLTYIYIYEISHVSVVKCLTPRYGNSVIFQVNYRIIYITIYNNISTVSRTKIMSVVLHR
jgi:hypothetical protein